MIGAVPLGIPLLDGPGSISVAILAASQDRDWLHLALLSIIAVAVAALARLALVFADRVASALGRTGVNIASRLMGIFSRHATEFIATGLVELFPILGARPGSAVH